MSCAQQFGSGKDPKGSALAWQSKEWLVEERVNLVLRGEGMLPVSCGVQEMRPKSFLVCFLPFAKRP